MNQRIRFDDLTLELIDTAGLNRKGRTARGPEVLSAVMTRKSIDRADVVLLMLDASQPLAHQDAAIAGLGRDAGAAMLLAKI